MSLRLKLILLFLWLGFMSWLIRFEAAPEWFTNSLSGYKSLLSDGPIIRDNWMTIEFNGKQVGYSHSKVDTIEGNPDEQYRVTNQTILHLNLLGAVQRVLVESIAVLDPIYRLRRMQFEMISSKYQMKINALRIAPETYEVTVESDSGSRTVEIRIPDDTIVYSPMLELSLKELDPGDSLNIRVYEPVSMQAQNVHVKALRRETLMHRGEEREAVALESELQGMKALSWIDNEGKTLRQETPMGWTMVASTPEEAHRFGRRVDLSSDVLTDMSVPLTGALDRPRTASALRLRLLDVALPVEDLQSSRQEFVEKTEEGSEWMIFTSRAVGRAEPEPLEDASPYLASSPFVQSDSETIQNKALDITGGETNRVDQILALYHWVYRNVEKNPTVSLPSALDVLKNLEGDCNEHTYLYTALARSIGIPTKIQVGIVYSDGAFYYHAWPAVHDGTGWVELDPTLGQEQADATHIALLSGEIADQLRLLSVIGRMKVELIEEIVAHD